MQVERPSNAMLLNLGIEGKRMAKW
jgi:hypothetical protein